MVDVTVTYPELSNPATSGSFPKTALQELRVDPIPRLVAKKLLEREHYLQSLPGGTQLAFGVFLEPRLLGVMTFGVGSTNAHQLVTGAEPADCLTLTRLWLSDQLPANSESRVLGIALRALRRQTSIKFLIAYADPSEGHLGIIYQATNWIYTGLSRPTPRYDLGDGKAHHSRTLSNVFGTRAMKYFADQGVAVTKVEQSAKHRYVIFLDPKWRGRLRVPVLPYPKNPLGEANAEEGTG